jgi:hypothetical protein
MVFCSFGIKWWWHSVVALINGLITQKHYMFLERTEGRPFNFGDNRVVRENCDITNLNA